MTMSRAVPSWRTSSSSRLSTSAPLAESRLPVGSSARRSFGRATSARAMAARCSSPPDSSPGRWSARSADADPLEQLGPAVALLGAVEQQGQLDVLAAP